MLFIIVNLVILSETQEVAEVKPTEGSVNRGLSCDIMKFHFHL